MEQLPKITKIKDCPKETNQCKICNNIIIIVANISPYILLSNNQDINSNNITNNNITQIMKILVIQHKIKIILTKMVIIKTNIKILIYW